VKPIPHEDLKEIKVDCYIEDMVRFWRMIYERQCIFNKKDIEQRDPPWTEDQILKNFKFTNVFREQDRGTRFVTDYIFEHCKDRKTLMFNVFVYRIFNKIETFLAHGVINAESYNKEEIITLLRKVAEDVTVFTNAFVVSGYPFIPGADKIERVANIFEFAIKTHMQMEDSQYDCICQDMRSAYNWFLSINGVGPFLAYQMAVDLSYSPMVGFNEQYFVIDGPGAKRGLRRLFPEWEIKRLGYENLNTWLALKSGMWLSEDAAINIDELFKYRPEHIMTVMDIENCLCEFSKYSKAVEMSGRPRNKYNQVEGVARQRCKERDATWLKKGLQYNKFTKKHWNPKEGK